MTEADEQRERVNKMKLLESERVVVGVGFGRKVD